MANLRIHIVSTRAELDAIMDSQWAGFSEPLEEFWSLWFPLDLHAHTGHPSPRTRAVADSKDRMWAEHTSDPHSTWVYISDDSQATGTESPLAVLASCQWRIYEKPTNPFPNGFPDIQCPAWPPGSEGGRFVARLARLNFTPRTAWMARPHVGLSWMAVTPAARRRGLGGLLMQWGIEKADSLGLEVFIEGSDLGKMLYQQHGLRELRELHADINPAEKKSNEEWQALFRHYLPRGGYSYHAMWRPIGGDWEGEPERSWAERFQIWDATQSPEGKFVIGLS